VSIEGIGPELELAFVEAGAVEFGRSRDEVTLEHLFVVLHISGRPDTSPTEFVCTVLAVSFVSSSGPLFSVAGMMRR
jgi:hypothetical protein